MHVQAGFPCICGEDLVSCLCNARLGRSIGGLADCSTRFPALLLVSRCSSADDRMMRIDWRSDLRSTFRLQSFGADAGARSATLQ